MPKKKQTKKRKKELNNKPRYFDGDGCEVIIDEAADLRQFKKDMKKLLKLRREGKLPCPPKTSCHSV